MESIRQSLKTDTVRFSYKENGQEIARAFLYIIKNDLHPEPYGLLEDVFVEEKERGRGLGTTIIQEVVAEAKKLGCYKIIATSRNTREKVHKFYEKLGFTNYGLEFRMDLTN